MKWYSEVVIGEDKKSATYELKVEAWSSSQNCHVSVSAKHPVNEFFDNKGYFHIRRAHDEIIDDIFDKLRKAINKSV